jgi:hypothetical protein
MSILAFFLAVGVGAHALDELQGRPLRTAIPALQLKAAAIVGIGGAVVLGILGTIVASAYLAIFIVIGVALALSYNLELFHGRWHTNLVFALSWGSFPVLTAYFAQHANLTFAAAVASVFAALVAGTQRQLSTPARNLRRRVSQIEGVQINLDGTTTPLSKASQLQPLESALRLLCWASVALAVSLTCARYHVL